MGLEDKILKRKIKRREKKKIDLTVQKEKLEIEKKRSRVSDENENEEIPKEEIVSGSSKQNNEKRIKKRKNEDKETSEESDESTPLEGKKKRKRNRESDENENEETPKEKIVSGSSKQNNMSSSDINTKMLSNVPFSSLKGTVSEKTLKAIEEMNFTNMTEIQAKALPILFDSKNLVAYAKTGSGKTLAFLILAVEVVSTAKFLGRNGTGAIVLCPTRELVIQTYGVLTQLMKYHCQSYGFVTGGSNTKKEQDKLFWGLNILVATPGRLLYHMKNTPDFVYKNCYCLIIDELDRMLDIGFEKEVQEIIKMLPSYRMTAMFSATRNKKTEEMTARAFKRPPVYLGVDDNKDTPTVDSLEQWCLRVTAEQRFLVMYQFLSACSQDNKKAIAFFSTANSVIFYGNLLNYINVPVMTLHGKMEQRDRTNTFFKFSNADSGILLCTDIAARGLDIPNVDLIMQVDPPDDLKDYIHRVGRTARGINGKGMSILFLQPHEMGFLKHLQEANIEPKGKYCRDDMYVMKNQHSLQGLIKHNPALRKRATDAYLSYLRAYASHSQKDIYDINKLDFVHVAIGFGFRKPPFVEWNHSDKALKEKMSRDIKYHREKNIQKMEEEKEAKMNKQKNKRKLNT